MGHMRCACGNVLNNSENVITATRNEQFDKISDAPIVSLQDLIAHTIQIWECPKCGRWEVFEDGVLGSRTFIPEKEEEPESNS